MVDRTPITVSVQWDGSTWTDVTAKMEAMDFRHGAQNSGNPDRQGIAVAQGGLLLRDTRVDHSQRFPCRVRRGSTTLWQGLIGNPRLQPAAVSHVRWQVVGALGPLIERERDIGITAQTTTALLASSSVWTDLTGAVPSTDGVPSRALGNILLEASPVGGFLTRLGVVASAIPIERDDGTLRYVNPARSGPTLKATINTSTDFVRSVQSRDLVDRVRNIGRLATGALTEETGTFDRTITARYNGVGETAFASPTRWTTTIPFPSDGTTYENVSAQLLSAQAIRKTGASGAVRTTNGTPSMASGGRGTGWWRYSILTSLRDDIAGASIELNSTSDAVISTVLSTALPSQGNVQGIAASYSWRRVATTGVIGYRAATSGNTRFFWAPYDDAAVYIKTNSNGATDWNFAPYHELVLSVAITADLNKTTDTRRSVTAENQASVTAWGERPLQIPQWLVLNDTTDISPQIDALSQVRSEHVVTLPLWQPTAQRSAAVASVDAGDWVRLRLMDGVRNVSVDATCLVTNRQITLSQTGIPSVTWTCLENANA